MSDLISRQAAIDALEQNWSPDCEFEFIIADVPSAQPEIIQCKECKRWITVHDRFKAEYGLCQIQTQLETTKNDDWCSRAERIE